MRLKERNCTHVILETARSTTEELIDDQEVPALQIDRIIRRIGLQELTKHVPLTLVVAHASIAWTTSPFGRKRKVRAEMAACEQIKEGDTNDSNRWNRLAAWLGFS